MNRLIVSGLQVSYGPRRVLHGVDLTAGPGLLGLLGPNGSGKSTLIKAICGIVPSSGSIRFGPTDLRTLSHREQARMIAYVPQQIASGWPISVFDAILLGRRPYMGWRPARRDLDTVERIIERLGLGDLVGRDLAELSGGERQKVVFARALAQEPQLLLLDEPTSALDVHHKLELLSAVRREAEERGVAAVMAIHDLNLAGAHADRLQLLDEGRVYEEGEPLRVLTEDNLREVYQVSARIGIVDGRPHVLEFALPETAGRPLSG